MPRLKAIERLLAECKGQGPDMFGFLHYIKMEAYEDAQREYDEFAKETSKQAK